MYNISKSEFLEENALYLDQQRLTLAILTLLFWISILWFITYWWTNLSAITRNLLLIPWISFQLLCIPAIFTPSELLYFFNGSWKHAILNFFIYISQWFLLVSHHYSPKLPHSQSALLSLRLLWLPMFITYSFSHVLFPSRRLFPISASMIYQPFRYNWSLFFSINNNNNNSNNAKCAFF